MQVLEFRAMNTDVLLVAEEGRTAADGLQAARAIIEESERRFSRFLPDSEITNLNASAGSWHPISSDLMDMLLQSREFSLETGGLFDPSILPDLKRLGYDKSMDDIRKDGASASFEWGPAFRPNVRQVEIDFDHSRIRLPIGMEIDLGGIAKGWIVERAAELLQRYTSACAASAGGDVVFLGLPADGSKWRVAIEDPMDSTSTVAQLQMGPGAVVTSSVVKRSWKQGGVLRHHLIDPRTGEPAASDWLSVTVAAPKITTAEVYAKALLIGGKAEVGRLAAQRPEISYFAIAPDGTFRKTLATLEYLNEFQQTYAQ